MKNNIVLIGMMGSGKSTIGAELSRVMLSYKHVDTDFIIEQENNIKISEIFEQKGEAFFRELEAKTVKNLCYNSDLIISVGGGAFENEKSRENLLSCGTVFYLKASPNIIYERIKNETHRPLLKDVFSVERITKIINVRSKNYEKAHHIIDTDGKTPYNIVKEILGVL